MNETKPAPSHALYYKATIIVKPQLYGVIGIVIGLVAVLAGLDQKSGQRSDLAGILLIAGIFLFGCGLIAAAIGARK
ncbi:MAG TPA: hypothetical protein PKA41_14915 [Verrucomicrobiota bacterium]|nr:hypothetical protein [Verrucomicrobiota bacterium]